MMGIKLLVIVFCLRRCVSFNISELLSSQERITSLLGDEGIKDKDTGYNVAKIKLSNEVVIELMAKGSKKKHGDEILRLTSEYTVGMNENTLDLVTLNDIKKLWGIYDEIFAFGKPPFIEYKCDIERMKSRFGWNEDLVKYFNYIRDDAAKAWDYFAKQFSDMKTRFTSKF